MAVTAVVADTDVVIDFLRGHGDGVQVVRRLVRSGRALVTAITVFELTQGALTERDRASVDTFCASRTVGFSQRAAVRAGELAADLRRAGRPIGVADTLIAGLCLHHGYPLATGNRGHFAQVPGLELNPS